MLLLRSLFFFLVFATCLVLGVWVVSKCGKGKEIYIFSYFGMFSDYIRDFEVFFFCLLGVWVLRKCGKVKRNWLFFFFGL